MLPIRRREEGFKVLKVTSNGYHDNFKMLVHIVSQIDSLDVEAVREGLAALVKKYENTKATRGQSALKELSEANVRKDFIDSLFEVLGWSVRDSNEYDAENYVRGAGLADVALKIDGKIVIFLEAKRFGAVPSRLDRGTQVTLLGYKILADWTAEERQVLNYAGMSLGVKWAILTNFEKFRLFNVKTGDTILNIEKTSEYLEKVDDLILLSRRNVESGAINRLESRIERRDVDLSFLALMNHWRVILANDIHKKVPDLDMDGIKRVVQRIIDRLVIIRYAEDKWLLDDPDQLRATFEYWQRTRTYTKLPDLLGSLFQGFDLKHDSRMFEKDQLVDSLLGKIDPTVLGEIINQLYDQSFRKFTSDILGSTYESYLGHELILDHGRVDIRPNELLRKAGGIYYTPTHVVNFIVDSTIRIALEAIWRDAVALFERERYTDAAKQFEQVFELKVLDAACGSGTFLIKAFEVFKEYCLKYNTLVNDANSKINVRVGQMRQAGRQKEAWKLDSERPDILTDFESKILRNCIFGIDLDTAAAEIAAVNLVLQALRKGEKLPLILQENIKVGNSLVSGNPDELKKYFSDPTSKAPFDWNKEFEQVLANGGFDCVLGNPPYLSMENLSEEQAYFKAVYPQIYSGKNDILYYFLMKGIELLKPGGRLGFIVSRYFIDAAYASKLRQFLLDSVAVEAVIDFGNIQLFEKVNVLTLIVILRKETNQHKREMNETRVVKVKRWSGTNSELLQHIVNISNQDSYEDESTEVYSVAQRALSSEPWSLQKPKFANTIAKLVSNSWPLGSLCDIEQSQKTGLNEAFCVDSNTVSEYHLEKDILRRLVKNSDIRKYYIDWVDGYLIYTKDGTDIDKYPNTKKYLSKFKKELQARSECDKGLYPWWRLQRPRREHLFSAPEKIVVPFLSTENRFGYDDREDGKGYYGTADTYVLVPFPQCEIDIKYILALLNSKCLEFYHKNNAKLKRDEYYEYLREPLKRVPIAKIDVESPLYKEIIRNVEELVRCKKEYYRSLHMFETMTTNFSDSSTKQVPIRYYLQNASEYQIDLAETKKTDKSALAKITKIEAAKDERSLLVSATYLDNEEHTCSAITLAVNDSDVLDYLYYCTKVFLIQNYRKANWGKGPVADAVLDVVKIPLFTPNIELNKKRITELVKQLRKSSPIGNRNLSITESRIVEIQGIIDKLVYRCYGLTGSEIGIIEEFISAQAGEISRTA